MHRDAHAANAGFSATFPRFNRDDLRIIHFSILLEYASQRNPWLSFLPLPFPQSALSLSSPFRSIETRSLPALSRHYPRGFTFMSLIPARSIELAHLPFARRYPSRPLRPCRSSRLAPFYFLLSTLSVSRSMSSFMRTQRLRSAPRFKRLRGFPL